MVNNNETAAQLNLPSFDVRLREEQGVVKVFDELRHRYVALTPEEWVRQHFVHFLISAKGYPAALMGNEVRLRLKGMERRCDTVVYDRTLRARMILEYKRTDVSITQRVFDQISRYNMVMHVDYLVVSNGIQHYCCRMDYEHGTYSFLQDIPEYKEIVGR